MNLRDLNYVVAVVEHGQFGRAAAACNVTQPTLSGQILKLEGELGIQIFERTGGGVRLTPAGEDVVVHARRVLNAARDLVDAARASSDPLVGALRLGAIPTLGPYLMPFLLPAARDRLPEMPLVLVEALTADLTAQVVEGTLDAALIATVPEETGLDDDILFAEPFFLAMAPGHPLAAWPTLSGAEIDPQSLLLLSDGHCLRDQALGLCRHPDLGRGAMADMRAGSLETLLQLVEAGYGTTLIPQLVLIGSRLRHSTLVVRPLAGPHASRGIRLISRKSSPRGQAIAALASVVRGCLPPPLASYSPMAVGGSNAAKRSAGSGSEK